MGPCSTWIESEVGILDEDEWHTDVELKMRCERCGSPICLYLS